MDPWSYTFVQTLKIKRPGVELNVKYELWVIMY